MLSIPVRHDETLEAKLPLQNVVLQVRVLAPLGVVDLIVRAHDRAGTSTNGIGKRPKVKFMEGFVIEIGADSINKTIFTKSTRRTEVLLFVQDVML